MHVLQQKPFSLPSRKEVIVKTKTGENLSHRAEYTI